MNKTHTDTNTQIHRTDGATNLCWEVTSRCNDNCRFCYRHLIQQELSLTQAQRVLDNLVSAKLRKITFTGGEALLYPHTWSLIRKAREAGVQTSLITNTLLLTEDRLEAYADNLDWITFSLDGPNAEVQARMTRNAGHFARILGWLETFNTRFPSVRLKVNTVAAAPNHGDIADMTPLMARHGVSRWKIFRFYPVRGIAARNAGNFEISDACFEQVSRAVRQRAGEAADCHIDLENHTEMSDAYISVIPDGSLRINDKVLGSLLHHPFRQLVEAADFSLAHHRERTGWLYEPACA